MLSQDDYFNCLLHLFCPSLTLQEMLFRRTCKLVEYENATKALEKAKPKNQEMVRFWQTCALHLSLIFLHVVVFVFVFFSHDSHKAALSNRLEVQVEILNNYGEPQNWRILTCFTHFFIFSFKKPKTMQRKHTIQFQKLQRKRWIKWYKKRLFVLLRLSAYCFAGKSCMPPWPGCISQLVLQADHPVVGLHVRHMSNNNMNICAIFMLKPEYQKISLYHTSE